jgi:hypothetical protein
MLQSLEIRCLLLSFLLMKQILLLIGQPPWPHRFRRPWILWCNQIFAWHLFNEENLQNNVVIYYLVRQQFKKCICIIVFFFRLFKSRNRKVLDRNSKLQYLDYAMVLAIQFFVYFYLCRNSLVMTHNFQN